MGNRSEIRLGDFVFDVAARDLRDVQGRRVALRNKSSDVLAVLAEVPDEIVPKATLMEKVWPDVFVSDDSLTQCIGDIRRALGDTEQSVVKTHVGKGYSLVAPPARSVSALPKRSLAAMALAAALAGAVYFAASAPVPEAWEGPAENSIAVLPFENIAETSDDDWFVDGMTADLTTDLSQLSGLFVTARNSSFVYKGQHLNVQAVSRELGVRYLLEGSVQHSADRIRIRASLVDGLTGKTLWSERFDEARTDVFELQDRITRRVVQALAVRFTTPDADVAAEMETDSASAYEAFLRGREHLRRDTPEDLSAAVAYFEAAVTLDPDYGRAHAALALVYYRAFERGWTRPLGVSWNVARLRAGRHMAEAWDAPTSLAYRVRSEILLRVSRTQEALEHAEAAKALDPNDPENLVSVAMSLIFLGRGDEAIERVNEAMRRDIHFPARYLYIRGLAKFGLDDFSGAETDVRSSLARNPDNHRANAVLAATLAHLGRLTEAHAQFEAYRAAERQDSHTPRLSDQAIYRRWPYKREDDWQRFIHGLASASGVPIERAHLAENDFFDYAFSQ